MTGRRDDPARDPTEWQGKQRAAAAERLAAIERKAAAENGAAAALLRGFVTTARERGLRPRRLRARAFNGRTSYRTQVEGWYLNRNRSLAVGTDGWFYVLSAPGSLTARFSGVEIAASPAPLVVGAGGRDGESMPLDLVLALRLDAGDDWPA